jgi:hypothetical protein
LHFVFKPRAYYLFHVYENTKKLPNANYMWLSQLNPDQQSTGILKPIRPFPFCPDDAVANSGPIDFADEEPLQR